MTFFSTDTFKVYLGGLRITPKKKKKYLIIENKSLLQIYAQSNIFKYIKDNKSLKHGIT